MNHSFNNFFPQFPMFPVAQLVPKGATLPDGSPANNDTVLINSGANFRMFAAIFACETDVENIVADRWEKHLEKHGGDVNKAAADPEWNSQRERCRARVLYADELIKAIDDRTTAENNNAMLAAGAVETGLPQ